MTAAILVILYVLGALAIALAVHFEQRRLDRWQRGVPRQLVKEQRSAEPDRENREPVSTERRDDRGWNQRSAA
jgi:hypothetical protein